MKRKRIALILPYLKGSCGLSLACLLFATLSVGAKMAIPFLTGMAIDRLEEGNFDIAYLLFACLGLLLVGSLFRYLFDMSLSFLGNRVVKKMRDELYGKYLRAPISYIDSSSHGDLIQRLIADVENVQTGLITGAGALFEGVIMIVATLAFMFYLHYLLALLVVLLTPISVVVSKFISSRNKRYFATQSKKRGVLNANGLESMNNLESIKAYGLSPRREKEFEEVNLAVRDANFKASFAASWINPGTRLVNNLIYGLVILVGAYLVIAEVNLGVAFSVGALSSFLTYALQYMTPFNEIADAASDVFYALTSLYRVDEALSSPDDLDEGKKEIGGSIDSLEAKGIDFSYAPGQKIISNFNLDVYKGHKIALVGPTGCGKTTVINLLMRFYDADKGGFYFNGIDSRELSKKGMRSHIGMVLQDSYLKHGTVRENIALARPESSFEEVVEAAKKARADDFIRRLPQGYDTVVGNNSGLSMGEKQLLCVARIILDAPEIVLLDEATSNIDLLTELRLSKAFDELMKGKTSLVVAHRLSTIKNADYILVMKKGKIVESGNFQELMELNGFFAELYNSQLS